jgi:TolB-like protein
VKIEPCDLPVMFRLTQTADLSGWQGAADDRAWQAFLGDVGRMVGKESPAPAATAGNAPAPSDGGIPIVAVLPITHRGGGEELELLAEDLTEEITRELSRSSAFEVIAAGRMTSWRGRQADYDEICRQLDVRYLAEGRLQSSGESVRLTMQVIDTASSSTVWSMRFACKADDVEASPEEFASRIVSELGQQMFEIEINRAMAKSGPFTGWEHLLRADGYRGRIGSDSMLGLSRKADGLWGLCLTLAWHTPISPMPSPEMQSARAPRPKIQS